MTSPQHPGGPIRSGTKVGHRYELLERISRGGMGEVWRAHDPNFGAGASVAVKVIRGRLLEDPNADRYLKKFSREANLSRQLHHQNIVPTYDTGIHYDVDGEAVPYLVMKLVDGQSLEDRLRSGPAPQLLEVLTWLVQAATGLGAAHEAGVIHRDIKPGNLLIPSRGELQVADFGLALHSDDTRSNTLVGTWQYAAPEQFEGRSDARTDVYSLGVVAYRCLTGKVPFPGASFVEVFQAHFQNRAVPPLSGDAPDPLADVVLRCLRRDPTDRYADGAAILQALQDVRMQLTPTPKPNPVPVTGDATHRAPAKTPLSTEDDGPAGRGQGVYQPARVRVHEVAKEFGIDSKTVLQVLKELGEFVKSASSTLDARVAGPLRVELTKRASSRSEEPTAVARTLPGRYPPISRPSHSARAASQAAISKASQAQARPVSGAVSKPGRKTSAGWLSRSYGIAAIAIMVIVGVAYFISRSSDSANTTPLGSETPDAGGLSGTWNGESTAADGAPGPLVGPLSVTVQYLAGDTSAAGPSSIYAGNLIPQATTTATAAATTQPSGFSGTIAARTSGCVGQWRESDRDGATVTADVDFSTSDPALGCTDQSFTFALKDGVLELQGDTWAAQLTSGE